MKKCQYFDVPDHPVDIEALWRKAAPLNPSTLPDWLTFESAGNYRFLGQVSCAHLGKSEQTQFLSDLEQLAMVGIIVESASDSPLTHRIYMAAPSYDDVWSIGICTGKSPVELAFPQGISNPVLTRDDISDVPAVFVADPFMLKVGSTWHMFFEVMNWQSGKGEIGLAVSDDTRKWVYRRIVLSEAFHLSYPYVFAWKGDIFMVPESYQAGAVRLYKARNFPEEWTFVGNLLDGPYIVDASLFRFHDRWWLFAETNPAKKHDTLRLYYADDLFGTWKEHPKSPLVESNPHLARPAGRVLVLDGRIIRYAQNCSPDYGMNVWAIEITEISLTAYRERVLGVSPILQAGGAGWNARGMHHIDPHRLEAGEWVACVDGWYSVASQSSPGNLIKNLAPSQVAPCGITK